MDYPKFIVAILKEDSICIQRFNIPLNTGTCTKYNNNICAIFSSIFRSRMENSRYQADLDEERCFIHFSALKFLFIYLYHSLYDQKGYCVNDFMYY